MPEYGRVRSYLEYKRVETNFKETGRNHKEASVVHAPRKTFFVQTMSTQINSLRGKKDGF